MKTLILQNLTHRGTVLAEGFLFSAKLLPKKEIHRRILSLWQPQAKVFRYQDDFILLLPQSFRVDCRSSVGLPLVRYSEILASFPLPKKDLEHFQGFRETIVLSKEGSIETLFSKDLQIENIETWFDVSTFQIIETKTLGEVKTKPMVIEKVAEIDLRQELKEVPKADEKLAEILHLLKQKRDELTKAKGNSIIQGGNFSTSSPNALRNRLGGMIGSLAGGIFGALKGLFSNRSGQTNWPTTIDNQPKPPSKLRQIFTKALFRMKIAQLLGRKQAQYLAKMMEMFENGNLEEALKHAIPLEDMQALKEMSEQMPFLGFLRPRQNLNINYGKQRASSSSVHLENQWFDDLRQLYRQTFDRLVAQNRIEEAAFVLAELLKSNHEAVEFLEKHGKYRLAAELAESRHLSKEIIVRQWFIAGEKRKAIQLAVLHHCFEYVVTQLEKQNHPNAAELREIWAENLAESGNLPAAINMIWKLENKREKAQAWIDKTIEFGGVPAAQMLAKKITLFPESFEEVKTKLQEILADKSNEAKEKRASLAHEMLRLVPNLELQILARPLARKLLADISKGSYIFTPIDFHRLVNLTQDYSLRTDLPKLPPSAVRKFTDTFTLEIGSNDKGSTQVFDACLLPDGKVALALGEAGVKIISKQGTTIAHFDQPTEKFIVSDFGTKAICLAKRGEVYRLAKVDFLERKASYWGDAKIDNFAPTFDGNLWFMAEKDDVYAIDANAKNFEAVWRVSEIGGQIGEIARSKSKLMLLIFNEKGIEKWWYDLPQFTLRSRNQLKWLEMENENQAIHSVSSCVAYSVVQIVETVEDTVHFRAKTFDYDTQIALFDFPTQTLDVRPPQVVENKYAISSITENGVVVSLSETPKVQIANFILSKNSHCAVKLDDKFLTMTDEFGRVIIFDHKEKILRKNIRY